MSTSDLFGSEDMFGENHVWTSVAKLVVGVESTSSVGFWDEISKISCLPVSVASPNVTRTVLSHDQSTDLKV
jgi:hypothetical protein